MRAFLQGMLVSPRSRIAGSDAARASLNASAIASGASRKRACVRAFDTDSAAEALSSMAEWYAFSKFVLSPPGPADEMDQVIVTLADLWYHAVYGTVEPNDESVTL